MPDIYNHYFFTLISIDMKIKMSALVSEIRNKLNGSVASRNRYGGFLRNKVTPVNPQTSFQQAVRQRLGSLSASWRGLTQSQRQSWIAGTNAFPFTDIFGDVKYLSGQTLFVKLNGNLLKIGSAVINSAPLPVEVPSISAVDLIGESTAGVLTTLTVDVTPATVPAGFSLVAYATPPVNPGIEFVKNRYRFLGAASVVGGQADLLAQYVVRFGSSAAVGQQIFVRFALVNTTTGQQGVPVETAGFITLA